MTAHEAGDCQNNGAYCLECRVEKLEAELLSRALSETDAVARGWLTPTAAASLEVELAQARAYADAASKTNGGLVDAYNEALIQRDAAVAQVAVLAGWIGTIKAKWEWFWGWVDAYVTNEEHCDAAEAVDDALRAAGDDLPAAAAALLAERDRLQNPDVEALADLEHTRWADWMAYLFSKAEHRLDGSCVIPANLATHWQRQVATNYAHLTEQEKESDRAEVRKTLALMGIPVT